MSEMNLALHAAFMKIAYVIAGICLVSSVVVAALCLMGVA